MGAFFLADRLTSPAKAVDEWSNITSGGVN